MQITLSPGSVTPATILFWSPDSLTPIGAPSWMIAILQYGGYAPFLNVLNFNF